MTQTYVITGASRGIGLEYVKQLSSQEGNVIYAGARNPEGSKDLMALVDNKKVFAFTIDVNSKESIESAAAKISESATEGIDVLINNAGISSGAITGVYKHDITILNASKAEYVHVFETNVGGVSDVTQSFLPLLRKRGNDKVKKIINMSSVLASISESAKSDSAGTNSPYKVSKTALNMLTELYAHALGPESFVVVAIHPGWVKTSMGGDDAPLNVDESVRSLLSTITNLTTADNGRFLNHDNEPIPW